MIRISTLVPYVGTGLSGKWKFREFVEFVEFVEIVEFVEFVENRTNICWMCRNFRVYLFQRCPATDRALLKMFFENREPRAASLLRPANGHARFQLGGSISAMGFVEFVEFVECVWRICGICGKCDVFESKNISYSVVYIQ